MPKKKPEPVEIDESSGLQQHALHELTLAGLLDEKSDYDGMLGRAALEIIKLFSGQGHSGASAYATIDIVTRLMRYEPLTPLTSRPEEWTHVGAEKGGPIYQSKRSPSTFSRDGGKTWYNIDDPSLNNGDVWSYDDETLWTDYHLGDVPIGSVVRVKPTAYSPDPHRLNGAVGRIIAARNGYITVQPDGRDETSAAQHLPEKLQRLV
jgi:hypothetical protein